MNCHSAYTAGHIGSDLYLNPTINNLIVCYVNKLRITGVNTTNQPLRSITQMESETMDDVFVVDGDFGYLFVQW